MMLIAAGMGVNMTGMLMEYNRLRTSNPAKETGFSVVRTTRIPERHLLGIGQIDL